MKRAMGYLIGTALAMAFSGAVSAQSIENTPETVLFSLEGGVRFEDNRDATERGKENMTSLRLTPGVRLTLDDEITKAFLEYRPSLIWRDNERDDQNDSEVYHAVEAKVEHDASYLWHVGGLNKFEMTDDPNVSRGGVTVRENASYWVNQTKGWSAYNVSERVQWDVDGSYLLKRYDERPYSDEGDEDRLEANTALRYKFSPEYYTFGFLGYDQPSYENDLQGDYQGYLVGVGVGRRINDQLWGRVSGGYEWIDYEDGEQDDEAVPYLQIIVDFTPAEDLVLTAGIEYSVQPSDRSYYSSKEYLRTMLRGVKRLSQSISVDAQFVYANGAYDSGQAVEGAPAAVPDGDDTLLDWQMGMTFRPPARRYYARLAYEFEDWDSDVRESFQRNTINAMVGIDF
ncbi:MAG: outer membrane beta-barrel protein [Kiritimatiellia bacterium]